MGLRHPLKKAKKCPQFIQIYNELTINVLYKFYITKRCDLSYAVLLIFLHMTFPAPVIVLLCALILACGSDVRIEKYPSGQVQSSTPYQNNQKQGTATHYYETGSLQAQTPYEQGQIHGIAQEFHPNGVLRSRIYYEHGVKQGEAQWFHDNAKLAQKTTYHNDKAIRFTTHYDIQGEPTTHGEFKDTRDGQTYPWVTIGTQIWMAQNLNYATANGSLCLQCSNWGRLYDLASAPSVCPEFFHLPSTAEWQALIDFTKNTANTLKAGWGWNPLGAGKYGNGTDDLGFGAFAGGGHFAPSNTPVSQRLFKNAGKNAYFWTATGQRIALDYRKPHILIENTSPHNAYAVRCVMD